MPDYKAVMRKRGCDRMVRYGMLAVVRQCLSVASERCNFGSSSCSIAHSPDFSSSSSNSFRTLALRVATPFTEKTQECP